MQTHKKKDLTDGSHSFNVPCSFPPIHLLGFCFGACLQSLRNINSVVVVTVSVAWNYLVSAKNLLMESLIKVSSAKPINTETKPEIPKCFWFNEYYSSFHNNRELCLLFELILLLCF